jgi:hypothetical protein
VEGEWEEGVFAAVSFELGAELEEVNREDVVYGLSQDGSLT